VGWATTTKLAGLQSTREKCPSNTLLTSWPVAGCHRKRGNHLYQQAAGWGNCLNLLAVKHLMGLFYDFFLKKIQFTNDKKTNKYQFFKT